MLLNNPMNMGYQYRRTYGCNITWTPLICLSNRDSMVISFLIYYHMSRGRYGNHVISLWKSATQNISKSPSLVMDLSRPPFMRAKPWKNSPVWMPPSPSSNKSKSSSGTTKISWGGGHGWWPNGGYMVAKWWCQMIEWYWKGGVYMCLYIYSIIVGWGLLCFAFGSSTACFCCEIPCWPAQLLLVAQALCRSVFCAFLE